MAYYLFQGSLTTSVWDEILKKPGDRISSLRSSAQALGGSIVFGAYSFGDYDILAVLQLPDDRCAGAFAMAAGGSTAFKAVKTTPLLSVEEGIDAMKKASAPPKSTAP